MGRAKLILAALLISVSSSAQVQVWNQDLNGSTNANKIVSGIQNHAIAAPTSAGALAWTGSAWTYSNPAGFGFGTAGQFLLTNAAGTASLWATISNDIAASLTTPGSLSVQSITPTGGTSTVVPFNASGFKAAVSPFNIQDNGAVTRFSLETGHGRGTFGGGGSSDTLAVIGPLSTLETTNAGIYLLPHGSALGNNWAIQGDGTNLVLNTVGSGNINFYINSLGTLAAQIGATSILSQVPLIQFGTGLSTGTLGTNRAGAGLNLQADAATTVLALLLASATFQSGVNVIVTAAHEDISQATAPSAPSAGTQRIYTDSADGKLKVIDSAGNITTLGI